MRFVVIFFFFKFVSSEITEPSCIVSSKYVKTSYNIGDTLPLCVVVSDLKTVHLIKFGIKLDEIAQLVLPAVSSKVGYRHFDSLFKN
jgi:hypothetical protein